MNYYMALRLRAMRAVLTPDEDAHLRRIFRWYSQTFHTPLHQVEELPVVDVLQAFYEDKYETMAEEDREKELIELLETEEERALRLKEQDERQTDTFDFAKFTEAEVRRKEEQKKLKDLAPDQAEKFKQVPESKLPTAMERLPEGVEIKFVSADTFEAELEGFGGLDKQSKG